MRRIISMSAASRHSRATSSAAPRAGRFSVTSCFTSPATKGCAKISDARSPRRCPMQMRGVGCCRTREAGIAAHVGVIAGVAPYLDEYPLPNGANLGDGTALIQLPVRSALDQNFVQGRIDANVGMATSSSRAIRLTMPINGCRSTYPQFPRAFRSRNQFSTGEYWQTSLRRCSALIASATAARASARTSKPIRHAARRRSCRAVRSSATSTSAACNASARRAPSTCACCSR